MWRNMYRGESSGGGKAAEEKMKATASISACEIERLPEELLSAILSRTATPRDACSAAAVSPLFRAAADSDAVWSCFLPRDLPPLADGELHPPSKKQLFLRLSNGPVLLADGLVSMWLDRESGAKCYMLSARALGIVWGSTPRYWRWIPLTHSRFAEAAELLDVCWLQFSGKMHTQMLTQNTKYAAYMVFKIANHNYGLGSPIQEAIVEIGEIRSTLQVCLKAGVFSPNAHVHVQFPQERPDGWMELKMGEFFNEGADNGEVSIILSAQHGGHWKKGLIVHGIEIRANSLSKKEIKVNPSAVCQSDGSGEPDTHQIVPTYQSNRPQENRVNPSASCQSDGSGEPDTHRIVPTYQSNRLQEIRVNPSVSCQSDGSGELDTHQTVPTYQSNRTRSAFGRLLLCFGHHSSVEGGASGSP